jgi:hypothetical protein
LKQVDLNVVLVCSCRCINVKIAIVCGGFFHIYLPNSRFSRREPFYGDFSNLNCANSIIVIGIDLQFNLFEGYAVVSVGNLARNEITTLEIVFS